MKCRTLSIVLFILLPFAALGQEDTEGCKDHPQITRFPGFHLWDCTINDFSSFAFEIDKDEKTTTKEGRFWRLEYSLKEGARHPSALEVIRNYENAVKKLGGRTVYHAVDDGVATYVMPIGKSERWFRVNVRDACETIEFDIIEVAAMEQKVEISATEMLDALNKDGFIALHGILFDTGKDTIKPESEPLLTEIVTLMKSNPGLKISVEGHTDNVGDPKMNQQLSQRRAESVMKWLVKHGVEAGRLLTKGWGDTKPIADNRTDEGRAKNRRVELVKR